MKIKEYENKLELMSMEVERLNWVLLKEREEKTGIKVNLGYRGQNKIDYLFEVFPI